MGVLFLLVVFFSPVVCVFYLLVLLGVSPSYLSVSLIWLIVLTTLLVFWVSGSFGGFIALLGFSCLLFFSTPLPLLMFFFMEVASFMVLFYLLFYGYQIEKISSCWYLLVFGAFSSLVFLWSSFLVMLGVFSFGSFSFKMSVFLMLGFLMKLPCLWLHLWLPKVHVESSTVGSVVLAALLLKLGCWGLVLFPQCLSGLWWAALFLGFGGFFLSLVCLFQSEGKALIAISSVVHMSFFLVVLSKSLILGFVSASVLVISHGVVSGLLFSVVGSFYSLLLSRQVVYHKGLMKTQLVAGLVVFIILLMNGGLAPTASFFVELWGLVVIYSGSLAFLPVLLIYFMFSFFYSLSYALSVFLGNKAPFLNLNASFFIMSVFMYMGGLLLV